MGDPVTLRWYEIDHKKAVKKTRTAIRHTTAIMRKQISADLEDLDVRTKPIRFEYVFSTETLGLGLGTRQRRRNGKNNDKDDHGPTVLFVIVTDITNPKLISDNNRIIDDNVPEIGDIVISVDGNKLDNNGVKYATNLIRKAGRPLAILFERKQLKQIEIELKQHIGMRIAKEFYNEELKPTIYFGTVDYISNIVNQWAKIRFDDGDEEDFGNECVLKGLEMYKQYKHLDPYSEDKVAGSPIDSECANVATTFTSRKTNKYRQQLHLLSTTTGCAVDADDVNDNDVNKDNGEQGIIDSIVPTKTQNKKLKLLKPNRTNTVRKNNHTTRSRNRSCSNQNKTATAAAVATTTTTTTMTSPSEERKQQQQQQKTEDDIVVITPLSLPQNNNNKRCRSGHCNKYQYERDDEDNNDDDGASVVPPLPLFRSRGRAFGSIVDAAASSEESKHNEPSYNNNNEYDDGRPAKKVAIATASVTASNTNTKKATISKEGADDAVGSEVRAYRSITNSKETGSIPKYDSIGYGGITASRVEFISFLGIKSTDEFMKTENKELTTSFVKWRREKGLPDLKDGKSALNLLCKWKTDVKKHSGTPFDDASGKSIIPPKRRSSSRCRQKIDRLVDDGHGHGGSGSGGCRISNIIDESSSVKNKRKASSSPPQSPLMQQQQQQQIAVDRTARITKRIIVASLERKRDDDDDDDSTDDNDSREGSIKHGLPSSNSMNARRRGTSITTLTSIDGDSNNNNGQKRKKKSQVEEKDEEKTHNEIEAPTRYELSRLLCMIVDIIKTTITTTSTSCTNEDDRGKYSRGDSLRALKKLHRWSFEGDGKFLECLNLNTGVYNLLDFMSIVLNDDNDDDNYNIIKYVSSIIGCICYKGDDEANTDIAIKMSSTLLHDYCNDENKKYDGLEILLRFNKQFNPSLISVGEKNKNNNDDEGLSLELKIIQEIWHALRNMTSL